MAWAQSGNIRGPQGPDGAAAAAPTVVAVTHGTNAATVRPNALVVFWQGSVKPTNLQYPSDFWIVTA